MNTDESNAKAVINQDTHPRLSAISLELASETHTETHEESKARLNRRWPMINADLNRDKAGG